MRYNKAPKGITQEAEGSGK